MDFSKIKILLTGGTGSFGQAFTEAIIKKKPQALRIFDIDEYAQFEMAKKFHYGRITYLIGDVRDKERLFRAMEGVELVVHAAALKQIPSLEYNPFEAVKTNIIGSQNIIDCAIDTGVKRAILISSDKAVNPTNLYGATKMLAEKLFTQGNSYVGERPTRFSVVRYGNVAASRGSAIPLFIEQAKKNLVTITDERMTRFWITLERGVKFVLECISEMKGGEIFVPKIPSFKVIELVRAIAPKAKIKIIGIRPAEKLHELLVGPDEARHARDLGSSFVIEPEFVWWKKNNLASGKELEDGFYYSSENNSQWLSVEQLRTLVKSLGEF